MIQRSAERAFDYRTAGMFEDIDNDIQRIASNGDVWERDNTLDAFKTSKLDAVFSCNCGKDFTPPEGIHRCACGSTWASFVITPNDKVASQSTKIVRPVNEHRERILATRTIPKQIVGRARITAAAKHADNGGLPAFVRSSGDAAPTVFDQGNDDFKDNSNQENPQISDSSAGDGSHKLAAGGWPATTSPKMPVTSPKPVTQVPATTKPAQKPVAQAAPATQQPVTQPVQQPIAQPVAQPIQQPIQQQPYQNAFGQPTQQQQMTPQPGYGVTPGATPFGSPATQQPRTYKKETSMNVYSESEFKQGFLLAAAEESLPERVLHKSFLQGYAAYYAPVVADKAPGWATVSPDFEKPKDGVNNSMSDYTAPSKPMDDPTGAVRKDLGDKIDHDNNEGQSRDSGSMEDLSGWKTSKLIDELVKRVR